MERTDQEEQKLMTEIRMLVSKVFKKRAPHSAETRAKISRTLRARYAGLNKRYPMPAAHRKAISDAMRYGPDWLPESEKRPEGGYLKRSLETRAKMSASQKARWANRKRGEPATAQGKEYP